MPPSRSVLFVDDDPGVLAGFGRTLRKQFTVRTAASGPEALAVLRQDGPFGVIVADMHMPGMDGLELLQAVKASSPDTVRIMLTGSHDQGTAINAINGGQIFRFLTKPCQSEVVAQVVDAALEQHRLITAERELLEQTLHGAIRLLTDILAFVDPDSFGRLERLRGDIRRLCTALKIERPWEVEVAAMLSPIGRTALPPAVLQKAASGAALDVVEQDLLMRIPETGSMLLANIPRLDVVSAIVLYQDKRFDGGGFPQDSVAGERIPLGARVLALLRGLDRLERDGLPRGRALGQLAHDQGAYDPAVLAVAAQCLPGRDGTKERPLVEITVAGLKPGHVLRRDIRTSDGVVLLGIGQVITQPLLGRIANYLRLGTISEPLLVEELPA